MYAVNCDFVAVSGEGSYRCSLARTSLAEPESTNSSRSTPYTTNVARNITPERAICARVTEPLKPLALPSDPLLAEWAASLNGGGHWAQIYDAAWRLVYVTNETRLIAGDTGAGPSFYLGCHRFSTESTRFLESVVRGEFVRSEFRRAQFLDLGPYVLATTPGGRDALRLLVDPEYADLIDELEPRDPPDTWPGAIASSTYAGVATEGSATWFRIDGREGHLAGFCVLYMPAAGMSQLAAATLTVNLAHLARIRVVEHADRRQAAILMADLEASSPLARRLSSAQYFAFVRHFVRAADDCTIDAGGIVGRHAGDGVVAFFLAETAASESSAASGCITAARTLRAALVDVAARSEIGDAELRLRFGLHWGSTLYVGRILTRGRSEVTALGDEMNETARIEACATRGRMFASKALIERLNRADADALGLETTHTTYIPLTDLPSATDKARRDAPSIAVCEL
jgi:class 3 adenylate cyclase